MSRAPARFTQADISRAIRAAKQAGAGSVVVRPDGSIVFNLAPDGGDNPPKALEPATGVVL